MVLSNPLYTRHDLCNVLQVIVNPCIFSRFLLWFRMQEDFERQQQSENRARQRLRDELQRELSHTQTQQREEVKALLRQQVVQGN